MRKLLYLLCGFCLLSSCGKEKMEGNESCDVPIKIISYHIDTVSGGFIPESMESRTNDTNVFICIFLEPDLRTAISLTDYICSTPTFYTQALLKNIVIQCLQDYNLQYKAFDTLNKDISLYWEGSWERHISGEKTPLDKFLSEEDTCKRHYYFYINTFPEKAGQYSFRISIQDSDTTIVSETPLINYQP